MGRFLAVFALFFLEVSGLQGAGKTKTSPALMDQPGTVLCIVKLAHSGDAVQEEAAVRATGVRVIENPDLLPLHKLVEASAEQLLKLTSMPEVGSIFPASEELITGTPVRGCPESEDEDSDQDGTAAAAYSLAGPGWPTQNGEAVLTWNVAAGTNQLPRDFVLDAMQRATAEWARYAMLRFSYTAAPDAMRSLALSFVSGQHGDGYPFDGRGGVLAHTFYPSSINPEPIAGDIHIDNEETWTPNGFPALFSVLLHEMGHALGLGHSNVPGSVMYPYYSKLEQLQTDDINAIRRLYAAREEGQPVTPAPLSITGNAPAGTQASAIDLSGTVSGGSGAVEVSWASASAGGRAEGGRSWQVRTIPLAVGQNQITVSAKDEQGTQGSRTFSITRNEAAAPPSSPGSAKDSVAPSLSIRTPATSVYSTSASKIRISGTAKDSAGVKEVTWQAGSATGSATGTTSWSLELPLLKGDNLVIVRASDGSGNTGWRSVLITRR